jgi:hypothetical protein
LYLLFWGGNLSKIRGRKFIRKLFSAFCKIDPSRASLHVRVGLQSCQEDGVGLLHHLLDVAPVKVGLVVRLNNNNNKSFIFVADLMTHEQGDQILKKVVKMSPNPFLSKLIHNRYTGKK